MNESKFDNVITPLKQEGALLYLLVDDDTEVTLGDRPIFGCNVTIDQSLSRRTGKLLPARTVIGWVDYVCMSKFACVNEKKHYVDATMYFETHLNMLILREPAQLLKIENDMQTSKRLLQFRFYNQPVKQTA